MRRCRSDLGGKDRQRPGTHQDKIPAGARSPLKSMDQMLSRRTKPDQDPTMPIDLPDNVKPM